MEQQKYADHYLNLLDALFAEELQELYCAERRLVRVLPELVSKALSPELQDVVMSKIQDTGNHVLRIAYTLESLGEHAGAERKCEAVAGMLNDGLWLIGNTPEKSPVRDAAIISTLQKIERYEIVSYESLKTRAIQLDHDAAIRFLEAILEDENAGDSILTQIALRGIDIPAGRRRRRAYSY